MALLARRGLLGALLAAPAIITVPGLLMRVKPSILSSFPGAVASVLVTGMSPHGYSVTERIPLMPLRAHELGFIGVSNLRFDGAPMAYIAEQSPNIIAVRAIIEPCTGQIYVAGMRRAEA